MAAGLSTPEHAACCMVCELLQAGQPLARFAAALQTSIDMCFAKSTGHPHFRV